MQKNYVFIMLGYLGSGKSFVSGWLAPHARAVHLRVDELRLAMFGADRAELYTPENKALVNKASRYSMRQILKSGKVSVILDSNNNPRAVRRDIAAEAIKYGATPVVVWVQTPLAMAKERTEIRTVTEGHVLFEPHLVEKMAARLEEPKSDELVITIDGTASAKAQQKSFDAQLASL